MIKAHDGAKRNKTFDEIGEGCEKVCMQEPSGRHIVWLIFPPKATIKNLSEVLKKDFTCGWFCELNHEPADGRVAIKMQINDDDGIAVAKKIMREAGGAISESESPWT